MNEILTATAVIGAVVLGVTQIAKQVVSDNKWLPILNVILGVATGVLYATTITQTSIAIYAWAGAISGLGAGGFYDLQANIKGLSNQNKSNKLIDEGKGERDTHGGE